MSEFLVGAFLVLAAWQLLNMAASAALRGHVITYSWRHVATYGGFALLFTFLAVVAYVGVI